MRLLTLLTRFMSIRTRRLMRRLLLSGLTLAIVALIVGLAWTGKQLRDEARAAAQHAVRAAELRGTIAYLNGIMTASAQLTAATGDHRWADRYNEVAPELDATIAEASTLASPETRVALASTTGEAHRDLATMERRALALADAGDLAAARALLDGPEFGYLEDVYASGIDTFGQDLASSTAARTDVLTDRAWLEVAGLALAIMGLFAASLTVRSRARLRRALVHVATVARTDVLTDLPNRRRFYEAAESMLAELADGGHALLLVNLDRFKSVNDAHGHPAGDEVLKLTAARLRDVVHEDDLVARVGGDEFALLLRKELGLTQSRFSPDAIAARIVALFTEPFVLGNGIAIEVGVSVGIATSDQDCGSVSGLMHRADVALSKAKHDGRHCIRLFEPGMDAETRAHALLASDLRQAIADNAVLPHYQPLVDFRTGKRIGVEMLARWSHPIRGMVSPDTFIPLAEELGLIGAMSERLLVRACRDALSWPSDVMLACNLSPLQLRDPGLPRIIQNVLAATGLPPHRLELEVTESALVGDLRLARASLDELKVVGVHLALDDFGTGYSSLRHLQMLPFDKVKIDRSFVAAMAKDPESEKIVAAVVGLGHSLGLVTVAEGVETEAIADLLRHLGCDIGQGWLYGRPVPADRIAALLIEEHVERHPTPAAA